MAEWIFLRYTTQEGKWPCKLNKTYEDKNFNLSLISQITGQHFLEQCPRLLFLKVKVLDMSQSVSRALYPTKHSGVDYFTN